MVNVFIYLSSTSGFLVLLVSNCNINLSTKLDFCDLRTYKKQMKRFFYNKVYYNFINIQNN